MLKVNIIFAKRNLKKEVPIKYKTMLQTKFVLYLLLSEKLISFTVCISFCWVYTILRKTIEGY